MKPKQGPASSGRLSPRLVLMFAIACGVAVANLFYAQPILRTIATAFGTGSATAGLVVTLSQIGYALGLALLVPLGDLLPRRRLVPAVLGITTVALLIGAAAPTIEILLLVSLLIGAGSVMAQVLVPMAASMADDEHRGQVVGSVMSGLLIGILLARTVSGLIASLASWRVVYLASAVLTGTIAIAMARVVPYETERPRMRYPTLLRSTLKLLGSSRVLRRRALYGALGFATFSAFWTTVAFLLSGAPYHYGDLTIGLFGLGGAAGALCATFAGRWVDRGLHRRTTVLFAALIVVSFALVWFGRHELVPLIAGILVLDAGVQGLQVTNQSVIYGLAPDAPSRITSAYMVLYFLGGAAGSAAGSFAYAGDGWAGACLVGAAIGAVALAIAVAEALRARRGAVQLAVPLRG